LGSRQEGEDRVLRWLAITHRKDGRIAIEIHEVCDEGSTGWIDVYDFSSLDPNEEWTEHVFDDPQQALDFAASLGASPDRFVNEGIVRFEYRDSLQGSAL